MNPKTLHFDAETRLAVLDVEQERSCDCFVSTPEKKPTGQRELETPPKEDMVDPVISHMTTERKQVLVGQYLFACDPVQFARLLRTVVQDMRLELVLAPL